MQAMILNLARMPRRVNAMKLIERLFLGAAPEMALADLAAAVVAFPDLDHALADDRHHAANRAARQRRALRSRLGGRRRARQGGDAAHRTSLNSPAQPG